jgi:hypothetical protein
MPTAKDRHEGPSIEPHDTQRGPGHPRDHANLEAPQRARGRPRIHPLTPAAEAKRQATNERKTDAPAEPAVSLRLHDEGELAEALKISIHWLRKDRRTKRIVPFFRIGTAVRYDLEHVRAALSRLECGGQVAK